MDLTVFYGMVEIYGAIDRQPTRYDYDASNIKTGDPDFLTLVSVFLSF